jgi:putative nucleotidyltransferase with HDIG domain
MPNFHYDNRHLILFDLAQNDLGVDPAVAMIVAVHVGGIRMNYQEALALMHEYTMNDALRKHMYAVEAAMRAYARKFEEDEETWAIVGILHDFDYEMFPNAPDHPVKGSEILKEKGYPEDVRRAILGHASYTNVSRDTRMAQILYACDELCGFLTACALVRPNKIADLELSSVKKKLKDKAFARNVNREDIHQSIQELGIPLELHIQFVMDAMKGAAVRLGLGNAKC